MDRPGVVHDEVDAAEREARGVDQSRDRVLGGDVGVHRDGDVGAAQRRGDLLGALEVEVRDHDARALGGEPLGDGLARCRTRRR